MPRLLFEKKGNAIWISHLDLMRVFQRAFKRAGLPLTHSHGFNPRPSVSIALPLSVGVTSSCELLDFVLDGGEVSCDEIRSRLNKALIDGVRVLDVYEEARKIRDLSLLRCKIDLEYCCGIPECAFTLIKELFARESLILSKKTKSGTREENIIPMICSLEVEQVSENVISVLAMICCQNPSLNPVQIVNAINTYLPQIAPDHFCCSRIEVYDNKGNIFR